MSDSLSIFNALLAMGYFPKFKGVVTTYYYKRAVEILRENRELHEILSEPFELLQPNNPDIWGAGGYFVHNGVVVVKQYTFKNYYLYQSGDTETYSAENFAHRIHSQFVLTTELFDFLYALVEQEAEEGQFFEIIMIREGDKGQYYSGTNFRSAEALLLHLESGSSGQRLKNQVGVYEYVQVCFTIEGDY